MAVNIVDVGNGDTSPPSLLERTPAASVGVKLVTRPWLMAWPLMVVLTLNILDRQVINVLGIEIAKDQNLSNSQLGLVGGLAFSGVYFIFGFPWGWIADRPQVSRVWVIPASLTIWSSMTALCGFASGFGHLLLTRMGVAPGEAGCGPAAHSLIAESAPKAKAGSGAGDFRPRHSHRGLSRQIGRRSVKRPLRLVERLPGRRGAGHSACCC